MYTHECTYRVRYADTDQMGYMYYGHYAKLYEIGRSEMIRDTGLSYRYMEETLGIMMPVLSLECRYRLPAKYDDLLTIRTVLRQMPSKMITFDHEILDSQGQLLNTGLVKLFFIDMQSQRRVSAPDYLCDHIADHFT